MQELITPHNSIFRINLKELWNYRDLLAIWVKRDISSIYKQTILGPVWFFLQPVLATVTYIIIFRKIANFSTSGMPSVLFYLTGIILWGYFAECIVKTSSFLKDNNQIFSKVYFPRLIIPLSIIVTNLIKFAIQFLLFIAVYIYFYFSGDSIQPSFSILLFPVLILFVAVLGLGIGLIVAAATIRYKDLSHLIVFGVQLMMFVSTVFFPLDSMGAGNYKNLIMLNPMSGFIEAFRFLFSGNGSLNQGVLLYDCLFAVFALGIGVLLFNHTEKTFVDTI
ncbi:MAG: ABC transporter permease [Gemmatimonadaceae bacterium]|nr:ABC transporter permease [Chitinophagaceae bacterium]